MADHIKLRGDTKAGWTATNPILEEREVGFELDTLEFKVGDGTQTWSQRPYWTGPSALRDKLASLLGDARLDASAIKNLPSGASNTIQIAIQEGDTPYQAVKLLFPECNAMVNDNGVVTIDTSIQVVNETTSIVTNCTIIEVPTDSLISAKQNTGNANAVVVDFKGLKSSIDELDEMSTIKTLEFPDNGLITGNEDVNDDTQLNISFLGLPTRKTNTGTVRRAMELKFPQANVFGDDGGSVTVGTGHSVFKGDEEINAMVTKWEFVDNGMVTIENDPNNENAVVLEIKPPDGVSVSVTNDDTQPATTTTNLYFPEANIEYGSTQNSKIIHTRTAPPTFVTSADTFTDYNKIVIADDYLALHEKQGETTTLNLGFNGISVEEGQTEYPAIKIINFNENDFNVDGSQANIVDITLKPKNSINSGFMAYYTNRDVIEGSNIPAVYRTTAMKPNFIAYADGAVTYIKDTGSIILEPETAPTLFKIVARATVRRQVRDGDFDAYMYLQGVNGVLLDLDGKAEIVHKTIKKELPYDYVELVTMVSVTENTSFQIIIKDNTPEKYIDVMDMVIGTSAIVVEKVDAYNRPSNAMQYYESLTNQSMRFIKRTFNDNFENAVGLIASSPTEVQTYPDNTIFARDGWIIDYQDEGKYNKETAPDNTTKSLRMQDMTQGFGFFNICRVLDYEDTRLLRGKVVTATVHKFYQFGEFMLVPLVWRRRINEYPKLIVVGMNNQGLFGTTDGWEVVVGSKTLMPASETESDVTCAYTVPSDAVNFGFMLMPTKQQADSDISFSQFNIGCSPAFDKWVIEAPSRAIDEQMYLDSRYAKFAQVCQTRENMSDWFEWRKDRPTQLYVGSLQAGANADVIKVGDNTAGNFNQIHNIGYLQFLNDGKVSIRTRFRIGTDVFPVDGNSNSCDVFYSKDDGSGVLDNATQIPASVHHVTIPEEGNVWNDGVRTNKYLDWTFTMDVVKDSKYFLAGFGPTIPQGAHLYSYPLDGYIEITFLEEEYKISQLETQLTEMKNLLRATTDALANKVYIEVGYDATNSKPTLEAKQDPTNP